MKRAWYLALLSVLTLSAEAQRQGGSVTTRAIRTRTIFTEPMTHRGSLKITDTVVDFQAPFIELGGYMSDPSTTFFTDLTVGSSGYLTGGAGDLFVVSGNFTNNSTQNNLWTTLAAELDFKNSASAHLFALAGADLGASYFGYVNNFAWGTFRLTAGQALTLSDGNGTAGAAFYVGKLLLDGGLGQIASIAGNGASIYYDPSDPSNNYLFNGAAGGKYALTGGGVVAPVIAVVKITSITRSLDGHVQLQGLSVPNRITKLEFSPDLSPNSFSLLVFVPTDAAGVFQYDDATAVGFGKRFYRASAPF